MIMVLGKDDGLSDLCAVIDLQPMFHQDIQDFADRILIEDPFIQGRGGDTLRQLPVFIFKSIFIDLLVFLRQIIIYDALLNEFQLRFHRHEIDQIAIRDSLCQLIAISRNAIFQFKYLVGVLVDLILWCRRQADQRGVKVVENILVFIIDGPVRLIADNQIEMPAGKELSLIIFDGINTVHHGLIG